MANETLDLKTALSNHRAKLRSTQAILKTLTHPIHQLLSLYLQLFDITLDTFTAAASLTTTSLISHKHNKQPQKGGEI